VQLLRQAHPAALRLVRQPLTYAGLGSAPRSCRRGHSPMAGLACRSPRRPISVLLPRFSRYN
jgi:hypothetical protein